MYIVYIHGVFFFAQSCLQTNVLLPLLCIHIYNIHSRVHIFLSSEHLLLNGNACFYLPYIEYLYLLIILKLRALSGNIKLYETPFGTYDTAAATVSEQVSMFFQQDALGSVAAAAADVSDGFLYSAF